MQERREGEERYSYEIIKIIREVESKRTLEEVKPVEKKKIKEPTEVEKEVLKHTLSKATLTGLYQR